MNRVVSLSLRFLLLYALLQAAITLRPLAEAANRLVASVAAATLRACLENPVLWSVDGRDIQIKVAIQRDGRWQAAVANLRDGWYTRNIPMLIALLLATARSYRARFWAVLGVGLLAVVLLDGVIAAAHAWATVQNAVPPTAAFHVLSVFGVWSLGGLFAAPMFVAALLALTLLGEPPGAGRGAPPARNAPCPCGSGQKYKRCCGLEATAVG